GIASFLAPDRSKLTVPTTLWDTIFRMPRSRLHLIPKRPNLSDARLDRKGSLYGRKSRSLDRRCSVWALSLRFRFAVGLWKSSLAIPERASAIAITG
ncbi:hypothetical protein, partial [Polymorphobacter multimanifer]